MEGNLAGYTVIVEKAGENYSAYVPDLPGCVTTGPSVEETLVNMRGAIGFHLEGLREDGLPIPEPSSVAAIVSVADGLFDTKEDLKRREILDRLAREAYEGGYYENGYIPEGAE